jgi:D-glycero-D-manno-heptose 1,7-bisphosphate phosphatase
VIEECGYLSDPELVRVLPGAAEALAALASRGVETHRRKQSVRRWPRIDQTSTGGSRADRFLELMQCHGIPIAASYFCPHTPEDCCQCRKPSPFLLERGAREHSLDLHASFMIGDRERRHSLR